MGEAITNAASLLPPEEYKHAQRLYGEPLPEIKRLKSAARQIKELPHTRDETT